MRRRDLLLAFAAAVAHPRPAKSQQRAPVIGYFTVGTSQSRPHFVASFHKGLAEAGMSVGRDVTIEHRWAGETYDQLLPLAKELVERQVDVIMAGSNFAAVAAKRATSEIPIIFAIGSDPIAEGLVSSFNRPGGNATGVAFMSTELGPKRLEFLRELVPGAPLALLMNARRLETLADDYIKAALILGLQLTIVKGDPSGDLEAPLIEARNRGARALIVRNDPVFNTMHERLAAATNRQRLPAMFFSREFVDAGGFASYSPNITDPHRQVGVYAARILKGEKPSDLPVMQPTRFEFVINLKTAKALELEIPMMLLARADEVIE